jgi:hypothetical protein
MLDRFDGKPLPIHLKTERKTGVGLRSRLGSSISTVKVGSRSVNYILRLPGTVDELCVIRSMITELPNHEPSLLMMNCGDLRQIRPSLQAPG